MLEHLASPIHRIRTLLGEIYRPEGVDVWLNGAHREFGGYSPKETIERGLPGLVLAKVERLVGGDLNG